MPDDAVTPLPHRIPAPAGPPALVVLPDAGETVLSIQDRIRLRAQEAQEAQVAPSPGSTPSSR